MLEYVDALVIVTSSPSLDMRSRIKSLGFGVVEHMSLVLTPRRMPNMIMSHDSWRYSHAANSSSHPPWNCGPRKRSGSDAGIPLMNEPLIRCISWRDELYFSTNMGGITVRRPESPSKHVPFKSPLVGADTNHLVLGWLHAHHPIVSALARVFPAPRPANISHMLQSPWGSIWCAWALILSHSYCHRNTVCSISGSLLKSA